MKISALFFIVLLTSVVVLPSSIVARDLKETDSVVQPQAVADPITGARPCFGKSYYSCYPGRNSRTRCSTYSRSCPP